MYNEWSLDIFYKGIDDPALVADMAKLEETVAKVKETTASLTYDDPAKTLREMIDLKEALTVLVRRLAFVAQPTALTERFPFPRPRSRLFWQVLRRKTLCLKNTLATLKTLTR